MKYMFKECAYAAETRRALVLAVPLNVARYNANERRAFRDGIANGSLRASFRLFAVCKKTSK